MNPDWEIDRAAMDSWLHDSPFGSVETLGPAVDKYEIAHFAKDDPKRFLELCDLLAPRDFEIMVCFGILQKGPTELSALFGKTGHRAQEDVHKAAHKLSGLIRFGANPQRDDIVRILDRHSNVATFHGRSFAGAICQYAQTRDFREFNKPGLRQQLMRVFKRLHATNDRDDGLLAGWLLWLVDGSDPKNKGWATRGRKGRQYQLGPTVFRTFSPDLAPRATGRGGRGQRPDTVKIGRQCKFLLRGL